MTEAIIKASYARQLFLYYNRALGLGLGCLQCPLRVHINKPLWKLRFQKLQEKKQRGKYYYPLSITTYWRINQHTELLAFGLPGRKEQRTLSTLMMAFQPWNFALLSSLWCSRRDLAFVKLHLLHSFHSSFGTWRWNYRCTISYFPPKWCHADVSYTIMHRRKKKKRKPSMLLNLFLVHQLGSFWLSRPHSFSQYEWARTFKWHDGKWHCNSKIL